MASTSSSGSSDSYQVFHYNMGADHELRATPTASSPIESKARTVTVTDIDRKITVIAHLEFEISNFSQLDTVVGLVNDKFKIEGAVVLPEVMETAEKVKDLNKSILSPMTEGGPSSGAGATTSASTPRSPSARPRLDIQEGEGGGASYGAEEAESGEGGEATDAGTTTSASTPRSPSARPRLDFFQEGGGGGAYGAEEAASNEGEEATASAKSPRLSSSVRPRQIFEEESFSGSAVLAPTPGSPAERGSSRLFFEGEAGSGGGSYGLGGETTTRQTETMRKIMSRYELGPAGKLFIKGTNISTNLSQKQLIEVIEHATHIASIARVNPFSEEDHVFDMHGHLFEVITKNQGSSFTLFMAQEELGDGSGSMGTVSKVISISGGNLEVIKKVKSPTKSAKIKARAALENEYNIGQHLGKVDGIVVPPKRIYRMEEGESSAESATPLGVMTLRLGLIQGKSFKQAGAELRALPLEERLELARQMFVILSKLEDRGVEHRDLFNSGNWMVTGDPRKVTLIDFGIATISPRESVGYGDRYDTSRLIGTSLDIKPLRAKLLDARDIAECIRIVEDALKNSMNVLEE